MAVIKIKLYSFASSSLLYILFGKNYPELGIRYFLPYSLIAIPLLQCTISLSPLRYFSEFCNTLFAICYSLLPLKSLMGFIVVDFLNFN
jgi:hypothetical protein